MLTQLPPLIKDGDGQSRACGKLRATHTVPVASWEVGLPSQGAALGSEVLAPLTAFVFRIGFIPQMGVTDWRPCPGNEWPGCRADRALVAWASSETIEGHSPHHPPTQGGHGITEPQGERGVWCQKPQLSAALGVSPLYDGRDSPALPPCQVLVGCSQTHGKAL